MNLVSKQAVTTDTAPAPEGGYSQAVVGAGLVFVSGQAAITLDGAIDGDTIEAQTAKTLDNVEALLTAAGSSLAQVLKTTAHISDIALFDRFDAAYRARMPAPLPARTTVESGIAPGLLIEIDVVAIVNPTNEES